MSNTRWLAAVVVAVAAVLAAGTTGLAANVTAQPRSVSENSLVNYDGTLATP